MIEEKGLAPDIADRIWSYVQMHGKACSQLHGWHRCCSHLLGDADLVNKLRTDAKLVAQKSAVAALNDLELLFRYLTLYNVMDKVRSSLIPTTR